MRKSLFICSAPLLLLACSTQESNKHAHHPAHDTTPDSMHTSASSVDWSGRYTGSMPCNDCTKNTVQLTLNESGDFELIDERHTPRQRNGKFEWDQKGETITLKHQDQLTHVLIGEGFAEFISADKKRLGDKHTLQKLIEYNGAGTQLFVWPNTVKTTNSHPLHITFNGLINRQFKAEDGHQSLLATFDIDCTKQQYTTLNATFYPQLDGNGSPVKTIIEQQAWMPLSDTNEQDATLAQLALDYCSQ